MNQKITLSYVMTTYNKLPYLKGILSRLIDVVQPDEEIVIVDGGSTDGTVEYLQTLYQEDRIHQFLSEPDHGEAHGTNKAILMARGELIKLISDDDAFYWPAIQKCKKFMLEHLEVDILGGNVAYAQLEDIHNIVVTKEYERNYINWLSSANSSFFFNGLPLMIRKSRLSLTGLFDTTSLVIDLEFSLRVTKIVNLAWCTSVMVVRVDNPLSNYRRFAKRATEDIKRLYQFHNLPIPKNSMGYKHKITTRDRFRRILLYIRRIPYKLMQTIKKKQEVTAAQNVEKENVTDPSYAIQVCDSWMNLYNKKYPGKILFRERVENI